MSNLTSNLIIPFFIGGFILAGVKYSASVLHNPKLSALIGAFPLGLFSIYYLSNQAGAAYGWNYFIMTSILLVSVILFNILLGNLGWNKDISQFSALILYYVLAAIHFFIF
jgi:hypothetical protein